MRLISLSDVNPIGQRDAELHQKRNQKDLDWEYLDATFAQLNIH